MKTNRTLSNLGRATFIFALSSFIFISCDQQEIESFDSTKDTPITIASAGVAELTTRVITDDNKLEGITDGEFVDMGVFVTGGSADKYNATSMHWHHNGDRWDCTKTVLLWVLMLRGAPCRP